MGKKQIVIRGRIVDTDTPLIMGIINISTDSFYSGNCVSHEAELLKKAENMLAEGADILDIGAVSTRPGAILLKPEEEIAMLKPALKCLNKHFPQAIISLDTVRAEIANMAVSEFGVSMINDISGGQLDDNMFATIARLKVPFVLMHMKGTPETMQQQTHYGNMKQEIFKYFSEKINVLRQMGVCDIVVDPGFGFSKNMEQNYYLLSILEEFDIFDKPVLVGISRKSMIWRLLDSSPEHALNGSTVLHTIAAMKGADILRVHDVKEAREVIKITQQLKSQSVVI